MTIESLDSFLTIHVRSEGPEKTPINDYQKTVAKMRKTTRNVSLLAVAVILVSLTIFLSAHILFQNDIAHILKYCGLGLLSLAGIALLTTIIYRFKKSKELFQCANALLYIKGKEKVGEALYRRLQEELGEDGLKIWHQVFAPHIDLEQARWHIPYDFFDHEMKFHFKNQGDCLECPLISTEISVISITHNDLSDDFDISSRHSQKVTMQVRSPIFIYQKNPISLGFSNGGGKGVIVKRGFVSNMSVHKFGKGIVLILDTGERLLCPSL